MPHLARTSVAAKSMFVALDLYQQYFTEFLTHLSLNGTRRFRVVPSGTARARPATIWQIAS
jgi:hypothetical protein